MMARMPLLAAAGGCRRLDDLWATAPLAGNWQEPLGQDSVHIPPWSSWPRDTKNTVLFLVSLGVLAIVCCCVYRLFCHGNKDDVEQDTSRGVRGLWSDNDDSEAVSAPPLWQQQEQQPPTASWDDGDAQRSHSGEGGRPPRRHRRGRQRLPAVVEVPAADVELATGDVQLTRSGVEWVPANMEWAPAADAEMAPAPEPAPTLKCTFSMAEGWAEGTCSVCLSELVDGEKVRVLTACMHCFHATCVEKWLHENATCPLCRAPTMAVPARGRRHRRPAAPNLSLAS